MYLEILLNKELIGVMMAEGRPQGERLGHQEVAKQDEEMLPPRETPVRSLRSRGAIGLQKPYNH